MDEGFRDDEFDESDDQELLIDSEAIEESIALS